MPALLLNKVSCVALDRQKPSTADLILEGVFGDAKRGGSRGCQKRGFSELIEDIICEPSFVDREMPDKHGERLLEERS